MIQQAEPMIRNRAVAGSLTDLGSAIGEIRQACEELGADAHRSPFFMIVGAGISYPPVPLAANIIEHCRQIDAKKGADMRRLSQDWTDDELVREIRRRERANRSGDRARAGVPNGRARDLADVPTGELIDAARGRQRVIYGSDNRQDLHQVASRAVHRSADAVVALVKASDLQDNGDGTFDLITESYKEAYDLCSSEPFVSQPTGCFCSGFLVAADVVATAGHCVKNAADLSSTRFVFGFRMKDAAIAQTKLPAENVYHGSKLLGRRLSADGTDWALVRLDRAVTGRKPVPVRTSGKVKDKQALYVVGHPCGLPQKYAPGANVRDNSPRPFFVANLDTFGGNSGSPVFNAQNNKVEGILVRGETDFASNGNCNVSLVCPSTGCRGEDVTRATVWAAKIPKSNGRSNAGARKKTRSTASASKKR